MWTKNEEDILIKLYASTDNIELSVLLNKNRGCIIRKANSMNIKKTKDYMTNLKKELNPKIFWNEDELKYLIDNYQHKSNLEISKYLNKTKKSIWRKLRELKIKRTKLEKDMITSRHCKQSGRDLNYEFVKEIASKYTNKQEFYILDPGAHSAAIRNGWIDDVCSHMTTKKESIPQLILKDILEYILKEKCSFNDRKAISPKEIDCYFDKYRLGFEYDGIYFHPKIDTRKIEICEINKINLIIIDENRSNFRNYELNIKNQLLEKLKYINEITKLNINAQEILDYKPKIHFSDILQKEEMEMVNNKKLSEIKKVNISLYKRILKYNLIKNANVIDDRKKVNKFKNLDDYKIYLKSKYNSYTEASKFEHLYRNAKKYKINISEVKSIWDQLF